MLEFVGSEHDPETIFRPIEINGNSSAYYPFEIKASMKRLLEYAYNDAIPPQVLSPSSLRTAYRLKTTAGERDSWKWRLPADDAPQIIRFAEHEEITPDLFTGAYYGYDVDRTMILYRYHGHNVFLSLAKQRDVSDVGKKGAALGGEEDWDYLYSGETGLNKPGLGWVRSYIYDSISVTVYFETGGKDPKLKCGSFKWLKAGWARVNVVQSKHIYQGQQRYASDLKKIIENRRLPDHQLMAEGFSALRQLSRQELRPYLALYFQTLSQQYAKSKALSRGIYKDLLDPEISMQLMEVPEMRAVVELEYLKALLGKYCKLPDLVASLVQPPSISGR
ncbi:MAG: hypothetical protein P8130_10190 [Deltaproteobacteria bacterium]